MLIVSLAHEHILHIKTEALVASRRAQISQCTGGLGVIESSVWRAKTGCATKVIEESGVVSLDTDALGFHWCHGEGELDPPEIGRFRPPFHPDVLGPALWLWSRMGSLPHALAYAEDRFYLVQKPYEELGVRLASQFSVHEMGAGIMPYHYVEQTSLGLTGLSPLHRDSLFWAWVLSMKEHEDFLASEGEEL